MNFGFIVSGSGLPSVSSDKIYSATYGLQGHHHSMYTSGNTIGSVHSMHFGRRMALGAELGNLDQIQKAKSTLVPPLLKFSKKFSMPLSLLQWTATDIHTQPLGSQGQRRGT